MTNHYIERVREKFEGLRASGALSSRLTNPTLASIRDECVRLFPLRLTKADQKILAEFFRYHEDSKGLLYKIETIDLDDLKALQKFIMGGTRRPNHRVVEMMAWLIDFEGRPYSSGMDYSRTISVDNNQGKPPAPSKEEPQDKPSVHKIPIDSTTLDGTQVGLDPKKPRRWKVVVLGSAASVFVVFGASKFLYKNNQASRLTGSNSCMYWNGIKYAPIDCGKQGSDIAAVPIPTTGIPKLERITRPDTITQYSVGTVYYIEITKGVYEFYTCSGHYPLDTTRELKRLTAYFVNTKLAKKVASF